MRWYWNDGVMTTAIIVIAAWSGATMFYWLWRITTVLRWSWTQRKDRK